MELFILLEEAKPLHLVLRLNKVPSKSVQINWLHCSGVILSDRTLKWQITFVQIIAAWVDFIFTGLFDSFLLMTCLTFIGYKSISNVQSSSC